MEQKQTMRLSYEGAGNFIANPTPEQVERLKDFKFDRRPELWDTGFFTPSQISSYYCKKCNRTYEDSLRVGVSVSKLGSKDLATFATYHCSHCNELVYYGHLSSPDGIPEEFIKFDDTGDYRKPTLDSVNSLLTKINDRAKEGHGSAIDNPDYRDKLETAKRWAEKIGYDINPQVEKIGELFRTSYVSRLERELPNLVAEIKDKSYGFSLAEIDCVSTYEGSGLSEMMLQLFETIKCTTPSNLEINKDIVRIFELYCKMSQSEKERLLEAKKDLEERITQEESFLVDVRKQQGDFIRKANIPNEQVDEARESPLYSF